MSTRRWAAAVVVAVTVGMNVGLLWVFFATDFLGRNTGSANSQLATADIVMFAIAAFTVSYASVGFLIAGRPGAGRIAAMLIAGGASFAAIPFGYIVGGELVSHAPESGLANAAFLLGPLAIGPGYALILPGLALVFPTGRFPSHHWNRPVWTFAATMIAGNLIVLILPGPIAGTPGSHNPFGVEGLAAGFEAAGGILRAVGVLGINVLGVAAVLIRYRSGGITLRLQLRWFVAAVLLAAAPLSIAIIPAVSGPQWALLASVGLLLVPVSVWIAVTRHRLYEIDRLISRTIGWAAVTGVLVAVFAVLLIGLQAILARFTHGETLAVAASTLAAFALFQPVRHHVQTIVDRRFDRARYDGERTAIAFAEQLRDEVDIDRLQTALATTAAAALHPLGVRVWLRLMPRSKK